MFYKRSVLIYSRCNKIKTRKVVKNKRLQNIKKLRFRIVLYKKTNSNKNLIKEIIKKDLQKLIDIVLIIRTTMKVLDIKCLIIKFSRVVKVQLASTII